MTRCLSLGQSQVLAYLERLAPGRSIHLMSFEKPHEWTDEKRRDAIANRIREKRDFHPSVALPQGAIGACDSL